MNTHRNTIIRRLLLGLSLCALVLFMFTGTGRNLMEQGVSLLSPRVAQSAIVMEDNAPSMFQFALEAEIYLPQEVDLTAGSDFIPQIEESGQTLSSDIGAMLNGTGRQCNFRDHMAGAVALNGDSGCI